MSTGSRVCDEPISEVISTSQLTRELQDALRQDYIHRVENDAKLRAIEQRVATYDEFRDIVSAAHLRPLGRKESLAVNSRGVSTESGGGGGCVWNRTSHTSRDSHHTPTPPASPRCKSPPPRLPPTSAHEFLRQWRRSSDVEWRMALLHDTCGRPDLFNDLHLPVELLPEIVSCLLQYCRRPSALRERDNAQQMAPVVFEILHALAGAKRFSLCLQFMSTNERESCRQLVTWLQECKNELLEAGISEFVLSNVLAQYLA